MSISLTHGLETLEFLSDRDHAKPVEIADHLGVSRATAFRIIAVLQGYGCIEPDRAEHVLRLGTGVRASAAGSNAASVARLAGPTLVSLRESTSETVNQEFEAELSRFRGPGFAADDGEVEVGAAGAAAPILGSDGRQLRAISIRSLAERVPCARRRFGLLIKRWCDGISEQFGYAGVSRQAGGAAR